MRGTGPGAAKRAAVSARQNASTWATGVAAMRVSYGRVYRRAHAAGRYGVATWVRTQLRRPRRPSARVAWAKHLRTLINTQTLCEHVDPATRALVLSENRLAHLAAVARLRVLQRHIVRYLWRPGGPMARKCEAHFAAQWVG